MSGDPRRASDESGLPDAIGPATAPPRARVRDRDVFLLFVAIVVVVIVFDNVSAAIEPLDDALTFAPIIVVAMVAVTVIVLFRSMRAGSRRG